MWPAETVSFHVSAAQIYDFSNRAPLCECLVFGFLRWKPRNSRISCPVWAGCRSAVFTLHVSCTGTFKKKQNKKANGMSHREPLCWRRGTVPVPYVDALAARRSTSHRLSLASKKKDPPVPSSRLLTGVFPLQLECKDLQPHQTAAPPTLPCTPTRVCKRILSFIWNVQFERFFAYVFVLLRRWNRGSFRLLRPPVVIATLQLDAARDFRDHKPSLPFFILNGSKIWWLGSQKSTCVCSKLFQVKPKLLFLR